MFPDHVLSDFALGPLADDIAHAEPIEVKPLPCDRWIARSCLQKAIRRGDVELALRALLALLRDDPVGIWRHLGIIALEEVGAANFDLVASVIYAGRNRAWREAVGDAWAISSFLVGRLARSPHCQAVCDLLLQAEFAPDLQVARTMGASSSPVNLVQALPDRESDLRSRSVALLSLAGIMGARKYALPASAVFELLHEASYPSHVVAVAREGWLLTRNAMALLFPMVWEAWNPADVERLRDDIIRPLVQVNGVPTFAVDQFTRLGGQAARLYLAADIKMRLLLSEAGIHPASQPRAVGDLAFLIEGSALARRVIWPTGERLRLPRRLLPHAVGLGSVLDEAIARLEAGWEIFQNIRATLLASR